jgi:hypothetical protein
VIRTGKEEKSINQKLIDSKINKQNDMIRFQFASLLKCNTKSEGVTQ